MNHLKDIKFVSLGSEDSYLHTDGQTVFIEVRRQTILYAELRKPFEDFKIGEIVEAGWINKEGRKFKSVVTNIQEQHIDFCDERIWRVYLIRTKD